ncbi:MULTISPECIES: protein-disulfide reductase DsbD N-terminal domain-containing protein [Burkholderia]|uniref:Protein-disulfide reductase DsbD N-terminal domain-containing protein n=1 Tax=Burkholderia anthinoferrum TaxID=3090833 RepID=A0ABU5WVT4_9BURK|nr:MULTISPECIES: protein-disulfide reductase DsbD N-terminal domain-containing protein [Burkholderia]MEB2506766.1 protein-disulfide reductase DsbD N-terminal domain-containing protein [Burkholderia anthinoferrum]MEB2535839.1 protein-disulfide reductase DsbD N-terminal domain-containing protein [Burkholderia anthinoferrum]MEB2564732.1 protein-disulfide reductase DsbD N-terminal domain-containing protein [Burkholderia anthinoferrum]MEB2583103.1 protein-disulfide reductase DsbD N-terminal domain-c
MTGRTRVLRGFVVAVLVALLAWIVGGVLARQARAQEFLSPEQAFRVRMTEERGAVVLHFAVADGYRLYGDRFRVASDDGRAHLGAIQHGAGKVVADPSSGRPVEVFEREVTLRVPVNAREMFGLTVTYQGCAINQICYPPMQRTFPVIAAALLSQSEALR